jgi:hypothetical protein
MWLPFLAAFAAPLCLEFTKRGTRLSTDSCIDIAASFFKGCESGESESSQGGAVHCSSTSHSSISTTAFIACRVVAKGDSSTAEGGALWFAGPLSLSCCCSSDCYSDRFGGFAEVDGSDSYAFNETGILSARTSEAGREGTIFVFKAAVTGFDSVNFTRCFVAYEGSASALSASTVALAAIFLTLVNLTGRSGIDAMGNGNAMISHSNFYNNSWGGVLTANKRGMTVHWCIFCGNSCDIALISTGSEVTPFQLSFCVFFAAFPPESDQVALVTGNRNCSVTASWAAKDCPVDLRSLPFSVSEAFSARGPPPRPSSSR